METHTTISLLTLIMILTLMPQPTFSMLYVGFYSKSCPEAEAIVNRTVQVAVKSDPDAHGKLLRLAFHDCFVEGCDGSILIDSTANNTAEKGDFANLSVGGFDIIDAAKAMIEVVCPGMVSCADIVALAARDAVALAGGPNWAVPTGRLDGKISVAANVRLNLPDTTFNLSRLQTFFRVKGLSIADIVILSGAHTIGLAHCQALNDRFSTSNGTLIPNDPSLTTTFAHTLTQECPITVLPNKTISLDMTTPRLFNNIYFRNLQEGKGLMHSDQTLFVDSRTRNLVSILANEEDAFFENFKISMVKLSGVGVKNRPAGEIRKNCRRVNDPSM